MRGTVYCAVQRVLAFDSVSEILRCEHLYEGH